MNPILFERPIASRFQLDKKKVETNKQTQSNYFSDTA